MKKIFNIAAPTVISTTPTPQDVFFNIEVEGGSLSQFMDNSGITTLYKPNRITTPLTLKPILNVTSGRTGKTYDAAPQYKWYIQKIQPWNSSTKEGLVPSSLAASDDYYLLRNGNVLTGSLLIRKNVDYSETITIYCVAEYSDEARVTLYTVESNVMLTTINKPDEFYDVNISAPATIKYNPLEDTSQFSISAFVTKGAKILEGQELAKIKFFWYLDGVYTKSANFNNDAYVSESGNTITVDAEYADKLSVKVKIAEITASSSDPSEPNLPPLDERIVSWEYPKIEVTPYCTAGSAVKLGDGKKTFNAFVKVNGQDVAEEKWKEYLRLEWVTKTTDSLVETSRGWGSTVTIPADELLLGTTRNTEVKVNAYVLGPLQKVICNNKVVVCDGKQVYSRD